MELKHKGWLTKRRIKSLLLTGIWFFIAFLWYSLQHHAYLIDNEPEAFDVLRIEMSKNILGHMFLIFGTMLLTAFTMWYVGWFTKIQHWWDGLPDNGDD